MFAARMRSSGGSTVLPGRRDIGFLVAIALMLGLGWASSADAYVYWTNLGTTTIGRANLDGSVPGQSFITGAGTNGVAVDGTFIYWTNWQTGTIGRANLDGSASNPSFVTGVAGASGLAVDGSHIYWSDANIAIGRANLDGSAVDRRFISTSGGTEGVAVDAAHIYWTNWDTETIGRANLDGSAVNQSFITNTQNIQGVAVDGAHVYWVNRRDLSPPGSLGRANLDGSGVDQSFVTGLTVPRGVTVDDAHVYWTNGPNTEGGTGTIGRANLDGSASDQNFITGADKPRGIAVDAPRARLVLEILGARRQVLDTASGLRATISCNRVCTATVAAKATIDGRAVATWNGTVDVAAATATGYSHAISFALKAPNYRRLRAALRSRRRVRLVVAVRAQTSARATATRTRTWTVALPPAKDAATLRAEKAFRKLMYANYGDPGPVVSCIRRSSTRWTCSLEAAYTGGGQLCVGPGAGVVRRSGSRYRATLDRTRVTCREE